MVSNLENSSWIWGESVDNEVNQYVEFRHEFSIPTVPKQASLYISVDSEYCLWVNGQFVDCGQYDDYPQNKVYDVLDIRPLLRSGNNVLCVLAYYQGESSFQYIKGSPGLIYALEEEGINVQSGDQTYFRVSRSYKNGDVPKISGQLSFSFEYDASKEDDWVSCNYAMSGEWKRAEVSERSWGNAKTILSSRPIRKLSIQPRRSPVHMISQGVFLRRGESTSSVAQLMQSDFLSYRSPGVLFEGYALDSLPGDGGVEIKALSLSQYDGIYLLLDLGRQECGFLELDLESEEGTVVDVAYGEHLHDLRVRAEVGGRNFAASYRCKNGRQMFTHTFKRIAGRYIQLHISGVKESLIVYYAGLRPVEYPVEFKGEFSCPDNLHKRIIDIAVRTLHLCMHEHYEDTPWREQALYSMDSRNQALCGYYCFGEYDFPEASFALLGEGLKADGYLEICAPAECHLTIPSFSLLWVIELAEHLLYSGRLNKAKDALQKVNCMMDIYISNMRDNLLATPSNKKYWHFYEWSEGMDGTSAFQPDYSGLQEHRLDAPLNLFFVMALESAAFMTKECGEHRLSDRYASLASNVKAEIHNRFWNAEKGAYRAYLGKNSTEVYSELTQALALCASVCPPAHSESLRERLSLKENDWVPITLSHSIYKFQALLGDPEKYGQTVLDNIAQDWGHMLYNGATSFWETHKGAEDFANAGSLCHGWSATPVYFYYAYVLGVRPIEPGFRTFTVEPVAAVFQQASGIVPTPYGSIHVSWERTTNGLIRNLSHPDEIACISD